MWLYVYGNGDFIYSILMSVNFFMKNAITFFQIGAVASLLLFAVEATGIMPTQGYNWTRFIKMYLLINIFVLTPYTGNITVNDVLTNKNYVLSLNNSKIPFGLIVPVGLISTGMHELITLYQQNYSIDANLNYSYSGMNFGANFIQSLDRVDSYDDKYNYNLDNYMQNCGFPLLHKAGRLNDLRTSTDIMATLKANTSTARYVQQVDFGTGVSIVKSCSLAITDLDNYYNNNKDIIMSNNMKMMGVNTTSSEATTRYLNAANATTQELLRISSDASTALKQAISMNMIMTSLKNSAQGVGNQSLANAVYDAEQFQQYKKTSELSGSASARTVPILVSMMFALLFFLYPIMIFLAIAMSSYKAIGVFFQVVIVINLIPLIYEILNYCSTYYLQAKLNTVIVGSGFNYDISSSLYSFTDNMIIAGNYLATSTPILAYALVTGTAVALTQVFGHFNQPAQQQAGQVGNESARGNMNLGNASIDNASYNNVQGNKFDNQVSMASGVPVIKDVSSGGANTNYGGKDYAQNHKSDLLATPNFAHMASSSLTNSLSHSKQELGQYSEQWSKQDQRLHSLANDMQSGEGSKFATGAENTRNLSKMSMLATDIQVGMKAMSSGGDISSTIQDKLSNDMKEYQKVSNELSYSSNQAVKDAFSNTDILVNNSSKAISESVATSQALMDVQSNQLSINTNFSNDFNNYLSSQGYDARQMSATAQTIVAQEFVAHKLNEQYGIKTDLQTPSISMAVINNLADRAKSNEVNNNDLVVPQDNSNIVGMGNPVYGTTNKAIDNFKNHAGNVVVNQVGEQANVIGDIEADTVISTGNLVKQVAISATTSPFKTFNDEATENMRAIKESQSKKDKE